MCAIENSQIQSAGCQGHSEAGGCCRHLDDCAEITPSQDACNMKIVTMLGNCRHLHGFPLKWRDLRPLECMDYPGPGFKVAMNGLNSPCKPVTIFRYHSHGYLSPSGSCDPALSPDWNKDRSPRVLQGSTDAAEPSHLSCLTSRLSFRFI